MRLYAKLEVMNPTGSVKDRVAKYLIEDLEASGRLGPDSIILEPTSGNTGIALAMIARRKGYRVAVVLPDNVTQERRQLLTLFGAEIIDSPGRLGSNGAVALAKRAGRARPALRHALPVRQPGQPARPLGDDGGRDHRRLPGGRRRSWPAWAPAARSWASAGGCARHNPDGRASTPPSRMPGEAVQGLRSLDEGFIPEIFDADRARRASFLVTNAESIAALRDADRAGGHLRGRLVGAVLVAAARVARRMEHGTIVALLADGGWKYLSETLWTRPLDEMAADLESKNWW